MPLRTPKKTRRNVRALVEGGPNPCPAGCTCSGSVTIDGVSYWVCITAEGATILVRKN
ncbi:MAG TPA: hypothetical protein VFG37_13505 [Planctomycetota bacterium]|nr:hypothetical protein [Planctomycetota bacterium]